LTQTDIQYSPLPLTLAPPVPRLWHVKNTDTDWIPSCKFLSL